jgi:hypothetical protein
MRSASLIVAEVGFGARFSGLPYELVWATDVAAGRAMSEAVSRTRMVSLG